MSRRRSSKEGSGYSIEKIFTPTGAKVLEDTLLKSASRGVISKVDGDIDVILYGMDDVVTVDLTAGKEHLYSVYKYMGTGSIDASDLRFFV